MVNPGTEIGPYRIVDQVGEGAMGRVFRARDERLDREVAVKSLPAELATDSERVARFEQEARAAAALNHPNVLSVYDVGTHEGAPYLVSELLEGSTLRELLDSRRPAPREAVEIARQIALGLAAAHERGIVHRDLKPANVFVTRDGRVKILDFGLAKLWDVSGHDEVTLASPEGTAEGVTVGTPAYMAPEQVRGDVADPRTDLFALGLILYEMLGGIRAFEAETTPEVLTAILRREPRDLAELAPTLPPALLRLVQRCLEKTPERRFQSARDLAFDLESILDDHSATSGSGVALPASPSSRRWLVAVVALVAVAVAGWLLLRQVEPGGEMPAAESETVAVPDRIAVLPFTVRGDERLDYLEEGMVDLLSTSLDGVGSLSTVDPHALLSRLSRREPEGDLTPSEAVDLADTFGAGLHVRGSVVQAGDRLRISASLYGEGDRLATAEADGTGEDEIFPMVEELVRELVAGRLSEAGERLSREGALTTKSVPALRAYLEGERAYRAGEFGVAQGAFRQAVEIDPDFALAWYRLAAAGYWFEVDPAIVAEAAGRAVELGRDLPPRDRTLLTALKAYLAGDADEAEALYEEVTRLYPDEAEAWFGLGETRVHFNPPRGRSKQEGAGPFARTLELDPEHAPALYHLTQLAVARRDTETAERLGRRYLEHFPDSATAGRVRTWLAILADDREGWLAIFPEAQRAGRAGTFFWTTAYQLRRIDWGEQLLLQALEDPSLPRAMLFDDLVNLSLAQGRLRDARRWMVELQSEWESGEPTEIYFLPFPYLPVDEEILESLHQDLEEWEPPTEWAWKEHAGEAAEFRLYWLGQTEVRLGKLEAAEGRLEALSEAARRRPDHPVLDLLAETLEAQILGRKGDPQGALAALDRTHVEAPGRLLNDSMYYSGIETRFLRAELLHELGRGEEAIDWYRSVDETCCNVYLIYAPWTHLQRARIHDWAGRHEEASWHYARFLELWEETDHALQPYVREAERRRAEIAGPRS